MLQMKKEREKRLLLKKCNTATDKDQKVIAADNHEKGTLYRFCRELLIYKTLIHAD